MQPAIPTLITADIDLSFFETILDRLDITVEGYGRNLRVLPAEELSEKCRGAVILISEYENITRSVIEHAPNLKFIGVCRGGVKTVLDIPAAAERGIVIANAPGRNANAVSDFVIGLLLDVSRHISRTHYLIQENRITSTTRSAPSFYRDDIWGLDETSPFVRFRGRSLRGKKLGIVGFGRVGRLVAEKAGVFGLDVLVHDPFFDSYENTHVRNVSFRQLLEESDYVSLSCSLTPGTRGLMSREQFKAMKPEAYLINTARGGLIDEEDLVWALRNGEIAGAALDVTAEEPLPPDSPLVGVENLVVTPHIAGSSDEVRRETSRIMADNLRAFLEGREPPFPVT